MNTVAERSGLKFYCRPECDPARARMNRIDATFARLRAAGRTALIPYVTAGDPSLARDAADHARAGRRRRRRDRARRAVLRSDGRRPGDPARVRARAGAGRRARRTCSTSSRAFRGDERDDAGRADGLRQSDRGDGRRGVRRSRAATPASTACSSSTIRPRRPREFAALLDARGIAPIFLLSPTTPEARIAAVAQLARGYVYYVSLKGVTGAGPPRHRRRRAQARRDPPARDAAGRRGLRHSRRGERAGDRRARRRRRHRQPHHPGDRSGPAGSGGRRAPARGSRASAARSTSIAKRAA